MIKRFHTTQSLAEPAGVPGCSLPRHPGLYYSFPMIKHAALLWGSSGTIRGATGIHILLCYFQNTQGCSGFLWTIGDTCLPFRLKVRVSKERQSFFFLRQERSSRKNFISFIIEGALERKTDLLCQIHCTSMWSLSNVPTEVGIDFQPHSMLSDSLQTEQ